ncbi:FAD-dependent oxidoreductase [Vagococcus intermedius]|uniref:FAD-dependent oxidoreductase n=1 Tax=Vagococcus intermedius TaxID=2991418 RepID=A0AAF0CWX3_9ENTE|nr:FAD-dependent oxidoreductase [Vagococcus intermedius]WEG74227.1 FAD-dependent oxidoreductase [Vagococcus intermedius]WEG76309.1 FAD-dependent oxidoreductase [Vagococcus intermedius]
MNIIIIGGSFAGVTAAIAARNKYPKASIMLIEKETEIGFIPSALPLLLSGHLKNLDEAKFVNVIELTEKRIDVQLGAQVVSICTSNNSVTAVTAVGVTEWSYDKLILATGSSQVKSHIVGIDNMGVIKYKDKKSAQEALKLVDSGEHFTIIGGGQVGIEMANALSVQNKKVSLVESMPSLLLKYFDDDMLTSLYGAMSNQRMTCYLNESVKEIIKTEKETVVITSKRHIKCDGAIFAINVTPNISYLPKDVTCHEDGTIWVNNYLQTSVNNIFAIGDCIQIPYSLSSDSFYIPLTNNAVRSAILAVENLEVRSKEFVGTVRTIGTHVFGYYLASSGMTESESVFFEEAIQTKVMILPLSLLDKTKTVQIKLIYSQEKQIVLGAQLISRENILEKINLLSFAIQSGHTLNDLVQKDYFFNPLFTPLLDITNQVGCSES